VLRVCGGVSPVSSSSERERQLNRLNRGSLRAEVFRPHTGRLPAVGQVRRRRLARNQVKGVGSAMDVALSPFVQSRQIEHGLRTTEDDKGFSRDGEDVSARLPLRHPAEAVQRSA
jgi:hypothetical protein